MNDSAPDARQHFAKPFDVEQARRSIGPRGAQRQITNRMGDFNAILDFPPAPKLTALMTLNESLASESELRGEKLFHGKAQCAKCHYGPSFVDDYMHDLQVERFYKGRPEGPIKTFALRGIKDSPPYLHDGRAATLYQAIWYHGGEAQTARDAFINELSSADQRSLLRFLGRLRTPRRPNEELLPLP